MFKMLLYVIMIYTRLVSTGSNAFSFISLYEQRYRKYGCIFVRVRTYTYYQFTRSYIIIIIYISCGNFKNPLPRAAGLFGFEILWMNIYKHEVLFS